MNINFRVACEYTSEQIRTSCLSASECDKESCCRRLQPSLPQPCKQVAVLRQAAAAAAALRHPAEHQLSIFHFDIKGVRWAVNLSKPGEA